MPPTQSLDHLILFVPVDPESSLPKLPSFFGKNFTLTPGGFHADGATSNTLILLADGCYIELISFIDPSKALSHWWGPDADFVGWKDWCLTNSKSPEENYDCIKQTHAEPIHGGRKRADGVDVKWAVTFPEGEKGGQDVRGKVPFFCHDITQRNIRVPLSAEKTEHSCGASGVQQLTVIVKDQALLDLTKRAYAQSWVIRHQQAMKAFSSKLQGDEKEAEATKKTGFRYGDVVLCAQSGEENARGTRKRLDDGADDLRGLWVEYV